MLIFNTFIDSVLVFLSPKAVVFDIVNSLKPEASHERVNKLVFESAKSKCFVNGIYESERRS